MPIRLLSAYIRRLPAIRAADQLRTMQAVALGMGTIKDAPRIVRELQQTAEGQGGRPRRPSTRGEALLAAGAIGMKVVTDG